jgi:amidase
MHVTASAPTVSAANGGDALGVSDACDLSARLRRREVSPQEVREAAARRLRRVEPDLNATVYLVDSIADAAPSEQGPFAGVPLPIKDTDDIAGYPTYWGSRATADIPAQRSSVFVRHLLELGFAPMAKTTLPEFGLTATTQSVRFGDTRNPWDSTRIAGGSSGGSAALVAAGVVPMAHANDGGGSIRIPASACGLVGLKPSRGRLVDRPELEHLPINLITQGILTRTVRDTARFYAESERVHANPALPPIGHVTSPIKQRLRVAVLVDGLAGITLHPEVADAVATTAALLERLGHRVEFVANPYSDQFARDFLRFWALQGFLFKRAGRVVCGPGFDPRRTDAFTDGLAAMFRTQAERVPGSVRRLRQHSTSGGPLFAHYDVVLAATLAQPPPTLDRLAPQVPFRTRMIRLMRLVTTTPLENVTGVPAISLPLARTGSGLPLGMQFSAALGCEALLLGLALELEEAAPWPLTPPKG